MSQRLRDLFIFVPSAVVAGVAWSVYAAASDPTTIAAAYRVVLGALVSFGAVPAVASLSGRWRSLAWPRSALWVLGTVGGVVGAFFGLLGVDADPEPGGALPGGTRSQLAAGGVIAMASVAVATRHRSSLASRRDHPGTLDVGAEGRAVWVSTYRAPTWALGVLAMIGVLVAVVAVSSVTNGTGSVPGLVLGSLGAVVCVGGGVLLSRYQVTAGFGGVHVRFRPGWPHIHIPLDEIERASSIQLSPMASGMRWGYVGSLRLLGTVVVVPQRGVGLHLELSRGRTFSILIPDASTAATLLNNLRDQARPG